MTASTKSPEGHADRTTDQTPEPSAGGHLTESPSSNPDFGILLDPPYARKPYRFSYDTVTLIADEVTVEAMVLRRLDDYLERHDIHGQVKSTSGSLDNLSVIQTPQSLKVSGSMSTFFSKTRFGACDSEDMTTVVGELAERLNLPEHHISGARITRLDLAKNMAVNKPPEELIASMMTPRQMRRQEFSPHSVQFSHTTVKTAFYDKRKELERRKPLDSTGDAWSRVDWDQVAPYVLRAEVRLMSKALPKVTSMVTKQKRQLVFGDLLVQHVFQLLESIFDKRLRSVRVPKALEAFIPRSVKELMRMLAAMGIVCLGGYEAARRRIASMPSSCFGGKHRSNIYKRLDELATDSLRTLDPFAGEGAFALAMAGGQRQDQ